MTKSNACRVLVAEDEPDTRHGIERLLGYKGYQVEGASDGLEAAEKLRSRRFDVVVSDLRMPRLDGMGLLRLTANGRTRPAFVIVTAYGTTDSAAEAKVLGVSDFIQKPFAPAELVEAVERGFRHRQISAPEPSPPASVVVPSTPPPVDEWLRSVWHQVVHLDLDSTLKAVSKLARETFDARLGFEKRYSDFVVEIVPAGPSSNSSPSMTRMPLYGELMLVLESWGSLATGDRTRLVHFLRRVALNKLLFVW